VAEMLAEMTTTPRENHCRRTGYRKAKYNGSFALGMEDPAKAATYASNILINSLPKDFYRTFLQKINALTVRQIQRASKKYFDKDQ
jgi:predicted Zn-dependent peptidase